MHECLRQWHDGVPPNMSMLVEYKPFEPAFYHRTWPTGAWPPVSAQEPGDEGEGARGYGPSPARHERRAHRRASARRGHARRVPLQRPQVRRRRPHVGSVNPFELFLIFFELGDALPRLTIDQAHNVEAKVEAMVLSVMNLQEAWAKAQLVDRDALVDADVLGGHEILLDAYKTDVRPQCAQMRRSLGAAEDPIAELRPYVERIAAER